MIPKPLALIIMDGWGINDNQEVNAIQLAKTPYLNSLYQKYPNTQLTASGEAVGLPAGQMGNSEVGHLNIGSGRIVYQDFTRISKAVQTGELKKNPILKKAMEVAIERDQALHIMGLLSDGGVHSHIIHLFGLLEMAKDLNLKEVYVHAFLDGRDVPPRSAITYIEQLETKMKKLGVGQIATVSGRYYAMDRDNRWKRVEKAYRALTFGEGETADTAIAAVEKSYAADKSDEFVLPTVILDQQGNPKGSVASEDSIIFYNFRADRAREITRALALPEFDAFHRGKYLNPYFVCMTEYDESFNLPVAFPPQELKETLAEVLSKAKLHQLRIAETEKYAHVTFFFNGGKEEATPGEIRHLIPSPNVATYDLKPEMSAFEVTDALLDELAKDLFDVIILNFANSDMVGHTGDLEATIKAVETVDTCLSKIVPTILGKGGQLIVTADHGNAEKMLENGKPHTAHTALPVPLIYVGGTEDVKLRDGGILADIAPTILDILEMEQPAAMTGKSLLIKD